MAKSLEERFWSKVDVRGPDECWPWTGAHIPQGYGSLGAVLVEGEVKSQVGAHRVSFFLEHGRWPVVARHSCDVKDCVNPAHILDGSHADNARDAHERGLHPGNGRKHWTHCKRGHEFTPENTRIRKGTGQRVCRDCVCERSAEKRARERAIRQANYVEPTHCKRGHLWSENAGWQGPGRSKRYCVACRRQLQRERRNR